MKKIAIYTILLVALGSAACSSTDDFSSTQHQGNELVVKAELVSTTDWKTRGGVSDDASVEYGEEVERSYGDYQITATREEWTANSDTLQSKEPITRGKPITRVSEIEKMVIKIFQTGTTDWSASSPLTASVIATRDGYGYTTLPVYNWSADAKIKTTLFTYSPEASSKNGLSEVGTNKIKYFVPATVADQPDFCVAVPRMNVVNNDGTKHLQTFTLSHQLTAVNFSMLSWNLKISKITVSGVYVEGDLEINPGGLAQWTIFSTTSSRDAAVTESTYSHNHNSSYADITQSTGVLMMLPQTLTDASTVKIDFVSTKEGAESGSVTAKLKDLIPVWNAGDKITYNIRLKTAPAVIDDELVIYNHKPGYTTSSPLSFVMDKKDNLTFSWNASWLKIHRGSPKAGDTSGGALSPWSSGSGGPFNNIYFFATNENTSFADRTAEVTVKGTRSATKKFIVRQVATPSPYEQINGIWWAKGNLVSNGSSGCKIGTPTDCGLFFCFGSLLGYPGGSDGSGVGQGNPAAFPAKVNPTAITSNLLVWYRDSKSPNRGYSLPSTDNATSGVGDPCRYYLGSTWRTPTANEYAQLCNDSGSTAYEYSWSQVGGRWVGSGILGGNFSNNKLFFPVGGYREAIEDSRITNRTTHGYTITSSSYADVSCFIFAFDKNSVGSNAFTYRTNAHPVRCVSSTKP